MHAEKVTESSRKSHLTNKELKLIGTTIFCSTHRALILPTAEVI